MSIRCIVVDDEPHAIDVLKAFILRTPGLELTSIYTNPLLAFSENESSPPDIAFLDVDMPGMNGLELASKFPKSTMIIFTTSYREYAADAYEQSAADYLLKPIAYERFQRCINKITGPQTPGVTAALFVKDVLKGGSVAVPFEKLIYISAAMNYIQLHLADKTIMIYAGLSELAKQLPVQFCRVHRSYIVNLHHIKITQPGHLILTDGTEIPVSRSYRKIVKQALPHLNSIS